MTHVLYMIENIINFIKDFLNVSYQDARGFFKLLAICFLSIALYFGAKRLMKAEIAPSESDVSRLDSMVQILDSAFQKSHPTSLFYFNPNTISLDSLVLLGIPERVAIRLINYRKRGAIFRVKSDVMRVYDFPQDIYTNLAPYISLPDSASKSIIETAILIDINNVDEQTLASHAGLDVGLARRVIRYRQILGGYITKSQLAEVYGMTSQSQSRIEECVYIRKGFNPQKIFINKADEKSLAAHPYISDELARSIIRYREVNGTINSHEILSGFKSVSTTDFEKLISYLDFAN